MKPAHVVRPNPSEVRRPAGRALGHVLLVITLLSVVFVIVTLWRGDSRGDPTVPLTQSRDVTESAAFDLARPESTSGARTDVGTPTVDASSALPTTGRIVDATSRAPLADALVLDLVIPASFALRTDAVGEFDLGAADLERCVVAADGYLPRSSLDGVTWTWTRLDATTLQLELERDELTISRAVSFVDAMGVAAPEVSFWFEPQARNSVRGHRSDETAWRSYRRLRSILDVPRADAVSLAVPVWFGETWLGRRAHSGADGKATARLGVVGAVRVLGSDARGRMFVGEFELDAQHSAAPIVVRERGAVSVRGAVFDRTSSAPVVGATVTCDASASPSGAVTAADGAFEVGPLLGTTALTIEAFGYRQQRIVDVTAPRHGLRIDLDPAPTREVSVSVTSPPFGRPLKDARVECIDGDRIVATATTDSGGRAKLQLPDEPTHLRVVADGYLESRSIVLPDDHELVRVLSPTSLADRVACGVSARIRGRLLGADAKPVEALRLRIELVRSVAPSGDEPRPASPDFDRPDVRHIATIATTGPHGEFEFECAETGTYRIEVPRAIATEILDPVQLGGTHEIPTIHVIR